MLVKLSTKGQLVIPKAIRSALRLEPGAELEIEIVKQEIVLRPAAGSSPVDALYGRFAGDDLIGALEDEHRQELQVDALRP